jgi:hypothetical protein
VVKRKAEGLYSLIHLSCVLTDCFALFAFHCRYLARSDGEEAEKKEHPEPMPAPKLSRTPGRLLKEAPAAGAHTAQVFTEWVGLERKEVVHMCASGDVVDIGVQEVGLAKL